LLAFAVAGKRAGISPSQAANDVRSTIADLRAKGQNPLFAGQFVTDMYIQKAALLGVATQSADPGKSEPKAMTKIREVLSKADIQKTFLDQVHTNAEIRTASVEYLKEESVDGTNESAVSFAWVLLWRSRLTPEGRTVLVMQAKVSGGAFALRPAFVILQSNARADEVTQTFRDITKISPLMEEK
jgi:hypothetical protein